VIGLIGALVLSVIAGIIVWGVDWQNPCDCDRCKYDREVIDSLADEW